MQLKIPMQNVGFYFRPQYITYVTSQKFKRAILSYNVILVELLLFLLTHWGRVTHICVNKLTIIGSDNGLSPNRYQAIIWTNGGILLIRPLGTNFSEILIEILTFSFKEMLLKVSSAERRPFCLGLNVLISFTVFRGFQQYGKSVRNSF